MEAAHETMLLMFPRCLLMLALLLAGGGRGFSLSLLHWNVAGNGASDWSTNSLQVQAIGRQMLYWRPEVVTFNEIPFDESAQMTNFVAAYLPGYFLAMNSGTDGYLRSAIASRYPVARSQKHLDGVSLVPFGYTNSPSTFTRDLFEAEIIVPGWAQRLHVFTTHLKATESGANFTNSVRRRAAEASAISNFFVTVFLPTYGARPYVLTGDLNEDIARPPTSGGQPFSGLPIQRLTSAPTGLRLTTPLNPVTASSNSFSIRGTLNTRLDYILPGGLLFSNVAGSQVFRTDRLSPMPPNLFTNDSETASDHLPVIMSFHNPYDPAPRLLSVATSNQFVNLRWSSSTGRAYRVEVSTNFATWSVSSTNLLATATNQFWSAPRSGPRQFFRVRQMP